MRSFKVGALETLTYAGRPLQLKGSGGRTWEIFTIRLGVPRTILHVSLINHFATEKSRQAKFNN